jgi:hypothetical protein
MAYTRPRSRGETALSRRRPSHKIFPIDRAVLREWLPTIVPFGVDTVAAVERLYEVFDDRDQRVRGFGGYGGVLRAISTGGRVS